MAFDLGPAVRLFRPPSGSAANKEAGTVGKTRLEGKGFSLEAGAFPAPLSSLPLPSTNGPPVSISVIVLRYASPAVQGLGIVRLFRVSAPGFFPLVLGKLSSWRQLSTHDNGDA